MNRERLIKDALYVRAAPSQTIVFLFIPKSEMGIRGKFIVFPYSLAPSYDDMCKVEFL